MQPLILSSSDIEGGAARATYRLHQGLQTIGIKSQMLVQTKLTDDLSVAASKTHFVRSLAGTRITLDVMPLKNYPRRQKTTFSPQWLPDRITRKVAEIAPNIINLHWINAGYIRIETITKLQPPLVWTLHDMWAFTGGCHYSQECDRYTESCGACPQLGSSKNSDLSRWIWQRKAKAWVNQNLTIISPSTWLAELAKSSSLFQHSRIEVIPHGMDTQKFKPIDRQIARSILNLPQDKKLVLFGAINPTESRKGQHLLQPALQSLSQSGWQDKLELAIFGANKPEKPIDTGFKAHYLGRFHDDISLALVYSAADVMVVPSTQEAFGQTASESLACGTPVVAFNVTGLKDIVEHQQNGYLAQPYQVEDLARGIAWILEDEERRQKLSYQGRQKVEREYTLEIQARRYASLWNEILSTSNQQPIQTLISK
ncbi:glycosyltransferase [Anabaena sp. UHCC 0187]|uniref:glycosyltransferase family 4 protein n=1 Tax=Anabaena sp. UHCC 0187 TaxID=2590018 RepID=UPI001446E346|nr:glycosyltransferase [Anabaena sp. UHCC 0187]